ncbi:MAG: cytidine deaminase [Alphaproteobacteria bacterium]|nr:cytidine deaminase [Alphaproteobacteria bacterium]
MNNTQKLFKLATQAAQKAYCPYSKFAVGAAILADDGNFYVGCNVENISYPVGTCAEAGAIAAMIAGGGKIISEIVIFADAKTLVSPCGACRQRIVEFSDENTLVHMANIEGIKKTVKANQLLPFGFEEF